MKPKRIQHVRTISFFLAAGLFLLFLSRSAEVKKGVLQSVGICVNGILPALFPMLAVSGAVARLGLPAPIERLWRLCRRAVTGSFAGVPASDIFGAVCGYPVGVITAAEAYRCGRCGKEEARRAALCNVSPGIAFSVLVTGEGLYGSGALGWSLLLSVWVGNMLLTAALGRCGRKREGKQKTDIKPQPPAVEERLGAALIAGVSGAIRSCAVMVGWIVLFGAAAAALRIDRLPAAVYGMLEVSAGSAAAAKGGSPALLAFLLGFGGVCVALQLTEPLQTLEIPLRRFLLCRLCAGAVAGAVEALFLRIFPVAAAAAALPYRVRLYRTDPFALAALILFCVVFMASVGETPGALWQQADKKRKKHT